MVARALSVPGRATGKLRSGIALQLQGTHGNRQTTLILDAWRSETGPSSLPPVINRAEHRVIQRNGPTPDDVRDALSRDAKDAEALASFDEWRLATAPPAFLKVIEGAGGMKRGVGTYDLEAAKKWFASKRMKPDLFEKKRDANEKVQSDSAEEDISAVNNSCDETDGTNRPGAAGNPPAAHGKGVGTRPAGVTSEGALIWETLYGQPWMTTEGHYEKVATYVKALSDAIVRLDSYKMYIQDAGLLGRITVVILRARGRINAMRGPLTGWNNRAGAFPDVWESSGKPKTPAVVSNDGTPVPGWPKNPGPV